MSGGLYIEFLHFPLIVDMFMALSYREAEDTGKLDQVAINTTSHYTLETTAHVPLFKLCR